MRAGGIGRLIRRQRYKQTDRSADRQTDVAMHTNREQVKQGGGGREREIKRKREERDREREIASERQY